MEINSRTVVVRHSLRNQCQQVGQAQHASKVWQSISDWESLYVRYREAGGGAMEFEDRRGQLLRILPNDMRREAFRRLNDFKTLSSLKEWIREQLEYERDWGMLSKTAIHAKAVEVEQHEAENYPKLSPYDVEALLALDENASEEEIFAVQQKFKRFFPNGGKGGCKGNGKGGGKGGGKGDRAVNSGTDLRCANCGKTGHMARDCRGERRDPSQRP